MFGAGGIGKWSKRKLKPFLLKICAFVGVAQTTSRHSSNHSLVRDVCTPPPHKKDSLLFAVTWATLGNYGFFTSSNDVITSTTPSLGPVPHALVINLIIKSPPDQIDSP